LEIKKSQPLISKRLGVGRRFLRLWKGLWFTKPSATAVPAFFIIPALKTKTGKRFLIIFYPHLKYSVVDFSSLRKFGSRQTAK